MAEPKLIQELFDILGGASKKPKVKPVKPPPAAPSSAAGVPVQQQPGKLIINPPPGGPPGAGNAQPVMPPSPATPPSQLTGAALPPLPPGANKAPSSYPPTPPPAPMPSGSPVAKDFNSALYFLTSKGGDISHLGNLTASEIMSEAKAKGWKPGIAVKPAAPPPRAATPAATPAPAPPPAVIPAVAKQQNEMMVTGLGTGDVPMLAKRLPGANEPTFEEVQHAIHAAPPAQIKDPGTRQLAERRERAAQQGYTTLAFKAFKGQPQRVTDVSKLSEGGLFSAQNIELAKQYAESGYGKNILPLLLDTKDYMVYNASGATYHSVNSKVIKQAQKEGKKGVVVINVLDHPSGATPVAGMPNLGPQTVYISIDPGTMRSPFAKFDPAKKGLNDLMASGLAYIVPPALAFGLFEKYGATPAAAQEAQDRAQGAAGLDELMGIAIGAPPESKSRNLDAAMSAAVGETRATAQQSVETNPLENKGFWAQLLGDIKMKAVESAQVLADVGKRAEMRNRGEMPIASPMELGSEFLNILSGGFGLMSSPVTGAVQTTVGRPLAQRETAKLREKIPNLPDQHEAEEAQAGEIADAASMLVPGMGVLPGVPGIAKFGYSHLFAAPPTPLQSFAGKIADDLHQLRQTVTADKQQLVEYVKTLPLATEAANERMIPKFIADRDKTELLKRVQEIVYHLIEEKDIRKLSQEDQYFLSNPTNLQQVLAAAKHIAPLRLEASKLYEYLHKIKGIPADELVEPTYVHRRAVGHTPTIDPTAQNPSPITGYAGKQKTLPTTTTALQERFYKGGEAPSGRRVVASQDDATGNWLVYEKGKSPQNAKPIDEEHFEYKGQTYTVGQATTREIEAATPTRYYKSALANTVDAVSRLRAVARHADWLDALKKNPMWKLHATQSPKLGKSKGWRTVDLPQLNGWFMDHKLAHAFEDFYKPGLLGPENALRKVNQFATASIFWNPTPHMENVLGHWVVGRGWDWITPQGARSMFVDGARAIRAVTTQNKDYQRLLKEGSGMIFGGVANANFYQDVARLAGMQITREPQKWDLIGRAFGLQLSPVEWTRLIYEGSKRTLWWANDVLMMQRVLELERKGMPLAGAIKEAEKHIPNYRIPTEVLGSRTFSQVLQEPALTVFSRYHYGVFRSYANMLRDALGPTASVKERVDALGNMVALGLLTWVVYPILDKALQKATGDESAEKLRRGPSARIDLLQELYEGKKNWGQLASDSITLPAATRAAATVVGGGRDPFTGQPISQPGSTGTEQGIQAADWALGQLVSPYQLIGKRPEEEGGRSLGRRVFDQVAGAKDTSEATERGRRIGKQIEQRRARKQRTHPRGFLERLYESE